MTRKRRITELEMKLQNPDLTLSSRIRDEATLRDLKYIDELEHRYCHEVVEQCEVCESCPDGWDIAWNEGDV